MIVLAGCDSYKHTGADRVKIYCIRNDVLKKWTCWLDQPSKQPSGPQQTDSNKKTEYDFFIFIFFKHTLQTRRRSEYVLVVVLVVCANEGIVSWAVSLTVLRITLVTFNYFTFSLSCRAACCPSKSPCIHYSVYLSVLENTNLTQILNSSNSSLSLEKLLVIIKAMQN